MTIVMIGQKGLPARAGGVERHVSLLAEGLASRGHRVVVYGRRWYVGQAEAPKNVEQCFTKGIHTKHLDAITHSLTALWEARYLHPEIVHLHGTGTALLTPIARLLHPRAKVVVTFHCIDWQHAKWGVIARMALRLGEWMACHLPHRTITVSQTLARYCLDTYGSQPVYIPHPFRLDFPRPSTDFLHGFHLQPERYLLLVARLIPHKQAHLLIEAYARGRARRPDLFRDLPLVIVGGGSWTEAYVERMQTLARTVPGVQLLGERSGEELAALQAHTLAHVFPTSSEGLAFAMLEAGAYARPAIVTDLAQNREATGGHAMHVRVRDVEDLCRGLIEVVTLSEESRMRMGWAMQQHVAERFSFADRLDEIERVYAELAYGHRHLVSVHPFPILQPVPFVIPSSRP